MFYFKLRNLIKNKNRTKRFVNLAQAKTILVLINGKSIKELNDKTEIIRQKLPDTKTIVCGFLQNKIKNEQQPYTCDKIITKHERTLLGYPKTKTCQWIQKIPCEILINLSEHSNKVLDTLSALSPAPMKCGHRYDKNIFLDLMIDTEKNKNIDAKELLEQILFYTKQIQVKN